MSKKNFAGFEDILTDNEIISNFEDIKFSTVDISLIKRNPHQPRFIENEMFEDSINELMSSIKNVYNDLLIANNQDCSKITLEDGLLQPIIVSSCNDGTYICVGGHRRLRACTNLGMKRIKANIVKLNETQLLTFSIIENLQRVDLTAFETALAINKAITSGSFKTDLKLANALGKSPSFISKCKNILKLPTLILEDLHKNKNDIGLEILNDLQRVQCSKIQEDLYLKYKAGEIKSHDIRKAIKNEKNEKKAKNDTIKSGLGFGNTNSFGTFITIVEGDFRGVFKFEIGGEFVRNTNNKEYKITIQEL